MGVQLVEPSIPVRALPIQPGFGRVERRRYELIGSDPTLLARCHEPALLEYVQVLRGIEVGDRLVVRGADEVREGHKV